MQAPSEAARPSPTDFLHLHFIVFLWGFTSILGALISLQPVEVVFWRTLMAVLVLWALFYRKALVITPALSVRVLATGCLIAMHWFLFFLAARVGNVSSCLAGIATGSVWTALLEPLIERKPFRTGDLIAALAVLAGLLLIVWHEVDKAAGVGLGVASAAFASLFSILNRRFVQQSDTYPVTVLGLTGAFLATLLLMAVSFCVGHSPTLVPGLPVGLDWLWLGILALACTVYAFTASVSLLKKFTAFAATLAVNMEPVYGIAMAWLIFGESERMSASFYIGTVMIIVAVGGHSLRGGLLAKASRAQPKLHD